jgi:type II secretory pathway pseudopilin PulG
MTDEGNRCHTEDSKTVIMTISCIKKNASGFTLLETVIAVFIFALIITSSLFALNRGLSIIQSSRNINIASSDISAVLELLRHEIDTTGTVVSRTYSLPNINETETVVISSDPYYDPMPVNVTINWQEEAQRHRSVSVDMLISERQRA